MNGRRLHLMGVGGVGMCGLAEVLRSRGATVSGCDLAASERTAALEHAGIPVWTGHDPEHLTGAEAVVVTAAIAAGEPELVAARDRGLPVVRRAELLAELMRGHRGVAVAGTHGKTSTTALIGHVTAAGGLDPTVVVGGRVRGLEAHARIGDGDLFVCEADEFDRAFLELAPDLAVVTNLEAEHLECYGDERGLADAFATFANRVATFGAVVLCWDDPGARELAPRLRRRVVSYGFTPQARLRAEDVVPAAGGTTFTVRRDGELLGPVRLGQPGRHLVANCLAALAVGMELGLDLAAMAAACEEFAGVARRFERRGEAGGVTVVDDYAHHPTEVRAALAAARQAFPDRRVVAVFQPHLYSRTRAFATELGAALAAADLAFVLPVYPARETPDQGVGAEAVVTAAQRAGHRQVHAGPELERATAALGGHLAPGDVLLTLGAGDVWKVAEAWLGGAA